MIFFIISTTTTPPPPRKLEALKEGNINRTTITEAGNVKHILLLGILLDTSKSQMPIWDRNFYPSCTADMSEEVMKPGAVSEWKQRLLSANTLLHSITKIAEEYWEQLLLQLKKRNSQF